MVVIALGLGLRKREQLNLTRGQAESRDPNGRASKTDSNVTVWLGEG